MPALSSFGCKRSKRALAALASFALLATFAAMGRTADDGFGLGSGKDGPLVAGPDEIVNAYTPVTAAATAGATAIAVGDASEFSAGDIALVVQIQNGAPASHTVDPPSDVALAALAVGQYDVVEVTAKAASSLTVSPALKNAYAASGAEVVRVPQYTTVTVPEGAAVTAQAWDGTTGGIVAFLATGAITMTGSGTVHANAKGFRGGNRSIIYCVAPCTPATPGAAPADDPTCRTGGKGEGFDPRDAAFGPTACGAGGRANGGGGGGHINAGGGGGGNAGPGGRGGNGWNDAGPFGGFPGAGAADKLIERLTFGGGGGGGQQNNQVAPSDPSNACRGGVGGGIVWMRGASLAAASLISANGNSGFGAVLDGAGGGGAGGSIFVRVVGDATCSRLRANGGSGGNAPSHGPGAGGGPGRIRLESRGGSCPAQANPGSIGTGGSGPVLPPGPPTTSPIEDAGGSFFGCVDAGPGACPIAAPICDAVSRVCRGCETSSECATGYCAPDGTCQPPPVDAGSDASSPDSGGIVDAGSDARPTPIDDPHNDNQGIADGEEIAGGGCSCRTTPRSSRHAGWLAALAIGAVFAMARRRDGTKTKG